MIPFCAIIEKLQAMLRSSAALVCATILLGGCDRARKSDESQTQRIDLNKLTPGPIRHATLTEEQIGRVRRLQQTFSEVDPTPAEEWMEDFKRDLNPDRELEIWENMAAAYQAFTAAKSLALDAKMEVYQVVLLRSGASDEEVLKQLDLKVLSEKEAREIMIPFAAEPQPITVVPLR